MSDGTKGQNPNPNRIVLTQDKAIKLAGWLQSQQATIIQEAWTTSTVRAKAQEAMGFEIQRPALVRVLKALGMNYVLRKKTTDIESLDKKDRVRILARQIIALVAYLKDDEGIAAAGVNVEILRSIAKSVHPAPPNTL